MQKIKELLYYNKKIFLSFCFLIIATIFLSFFLLLYTQFEKITYKTLSSYSNEFLERIDTMSLSLLNNIKESAMQMFYTSSIKNLRIKNTLTTAERITGLRDLGNFVSSSDILDSIIIYNSHLNMIFSSTSDYPSVKVTDFPDKQAVEILTHPENYPYLAPIKHHLGSKACYSFLFYESQSSNHSALLVNIKASWYESQLWGISMENDYIIMDSDGNIVISNNMMLSDQVNTYWQEIIKESNQNTGEGFIIPGVFSTQPGYLCHKIQNSNWYYIRPINLNTIVPEFIAMRNFLFISFSIISALIILFILYLLIKVYFPFHYIKNVLLSYNHSTPNKHTSIEHLIKQLQETSYIQTITKLHSGILPFGFSYPIVLIISEHCDVKSLQSLLEHYFDNVLIAKNEKILTCGVHSCTKRQFERFLNSATEHYSHKLYISNLCFSSEDLVKSHEALVELRQLSFLYPETLIMSENLLDECPSISEFQVKDVSSLISALKLGHFEDAWNCWHTIFTSISKDHYSDFLFAIHYLNNQLTYLETELTLKNTLEIDTLLSELTHVMYLHEYFQKRFLLIAEASASKRQKHLEDLSSKIDKYISNHYEEDTFTPQQVADAFKMNLAYLNRQYRQSSDISISDAIHRIRIEQACTLLNATDESIEIIANKVGYSNTKYFFVIFKKWTGLTPKQYRTFKDSHN